MVAKLVAEPDAGRVPFGILPGEHVRVGDHIAYFWETPKEFTQGAEFLRLGLEANDHCVIFGHERANARVCETLTASGVSIERGIRDNRLTVVGPASTGDESLARLADVFQSAVARGAPLIRLLGNIGWGMSDWPEEEDILRFEAKVTGAAKQFPAVIVCMYDVQSLSGRVIVHGGLGTHPISVCGNVMRVNPYLVTKFDEFAARVHETAPKLR